MDIMDSPLTQLGVGGIFMILTFRELLQFLRGYKGKNQTVDPAGERPTEYWNAQFANIIVNTATTPILQRIKESQEKMSENVQIMARHLEDNSDNVRRLSDNINRMSENVVRLLERRQRER